MSGTVSMSKTSVGVMAQSVAAFPCAVPGASAHPALCACSARQAWREMVPLRRSPCASTRKYAGREVAIAAVADDEHDRRVLDLLRHAQGDRACAAGGCADEDAFLAREPPCLKLGVDLRQVDQALAAYRIVDLGQIRLGPLEDAGNLRAPLRLTADDLNRG